jgi:catechol 2,3-dioxygenase
MGRLPADARLGAIRLRAGDVERLRDFYERTIGLELLEREDDVVSLGVDGTPLVELVAGPEAPVRPPRSTGLFHLALLVPSRADLARTLRRVAGSGASLSGASDHLVSEALYLSDPEGNGIELYRDRPRDEWPMAGESVEMATLPLDLESLLGEPGGEAAAASMPEGTILGHVHLQVAHLDAAEAFWVDALGLDVTVDGSGMVQFTRLVATNVRADVSGSGSIFVTATESLDASVSGSGAILYNGSPQDVSRNVTGSGAITGS